MDYDPSVVNAWAQAYGNPTTPTARSTMPASNGLSQMDAWNTYNPSDYKSSLNPDLLNGIMNSGWRTSPTADYGSGGFGQFTYQAGQPIYSSDPNGNPMPVTYGNGEINYHPQGQGVGENYHVYDTNGKYLRDDTGSKVQSYASGVLSVLGAAAGMGAGFGASAGADGYAAGGYLGGGGAGAGAAAGGGAGVTGFGDAGTMYAGGNADAAGTLGGGASLGGAGTAASGTLGATGGSSGLSSILSQLAKGGGSSLLSSLIGGSGSGGNNSSGNGLSSIMSLLGGGLDSYNQNKAATTMRQWLDSNQASMNSYMNPGSPEYNQLWEQMSRNDAAAGRNSQYGPRSADFAAKVAQAKASNTLNFTTGNSRAYANALNQSASAPAGLAAALGRASQNGSLNMNSLTSILHSLGMGSNASASTGLNDSSSNQDYLNSINANGGSPIDYNAGASDPSEQDVLDEIARWGM